MLYQVLALGRRLRQRARHHALVLRNRFSNAPLLGDVPVIVSLTSYGKRVNDVWATIEHIGAGVAKPQRIVLFLDEGLAACELPGQLVRLRHRGLEIHFVEDIGPYKKFFYALPFAKSDNLLIVTADDDTLYPTCWLEKLYAASVADPATIMCYRSREVSFDLNGQVRPYSDWPFVEHTEARFSVFFTGGSGVLYPARFIEALLVAGSTFREKCPRGDDIWLNYVATKSGIPARQLFPWASNFPEIPGSQDSALWVSNLAGANDAQITATYDPDTLGRLRGSVGLATPGGSVNTDPLEAAGFPSSALPQ